MQVTFMTRLIVALIEELQSKGFKIDLVELTEDKIEVLEFHNGDIGYNIHVSTEKGEQGEYLKISGVMIKEDRRRDWRDMGSLEEMVMNSIGSGDKIAIDYILNVVRSIKCLDSKFSMENIDKNATRAIALDVIGTIVNS